LPQYPCEVKFDIYGHNSQREWGLTSEVHPATNIWTASAILTSRLYFQISKWQSHSWCTRACNSWDRFIPDCMQVARFTSHSKQCTCSWSHILPTTVELKWAMAVNRKIKVHSMLAFQHC